MIGDSIGEIPPFGNKPRISTDRLIAYSIAMRHCTLWRFQLFIKPVCPAFTHKKVTGQGMDWPRIGISLHTNRSSMDLQQRIEAFARLGDQLLSDSKPGLPSELNGVIECAHTLNPWFTGDSVRFAINSIAEQWLSPATLSAWMGKYPAGLLNPERIKTIGVVMAGNIPLVGFHDFLCVLISGHRYLGKLSSKDGNLMKTLTRMLIGIEPLFEPLISITENSLQQFDAVIATGSSNTSRYFEYYFRSFPSIIRKHRNSVAVLTGQEPVDALKGLGTDIFAFFGLGCRNVSKLLVPEGYDFGPLLDTLCQHSELIRHHKYANSYEYHRALYIMNQAAHYDTGYLIVAPDEAIGSPVGVLYYQEFGNLTDVKGYIDRNREGIQCVVANVPLNFPTVPFGQTQHPAIDDYADGVDTIKFLGNLG